MTEAGSIGLAHLVVGGHLGVALAAELLAEHLPRPAFLARPDVLGRPLDRLAHRRRHASEGVPKLHRSPGVGSRVRARRRLEDLLQDLIDVRKAGVHPEQFAGTLGERPIRAIAFAEDLPEHLDALPEVVVDVGVGLRPDLRRTPRAERTARRRVPGRGRRPAEGDPVALARRVGRGDRRQQRVGVGVRRIVEQLLAVPDFHHVPEIHHRDPITDVADDREVVGDEQVREPELVLKVLQEVQDLRLDGDVERAHGLVEHHELGFEGERARDPDALALSARELMGVAVVVFLP